MDDLTLGEERFTGTRRTQHDPIGTFQSLAVCNDDLIRQGVHAVVQSTRLIHLAGAERQENRRSAGGHAALDLHQIDAQRQRGHISLLLLIVQPNEFAVRGAGDAAHRGQNVFELLSAWCDMHHEDRHHKELFIVALQCLQQIFRFFSVGFQIRRENIVIVAGAGSAFLFVDLRLIQIGQLALNGFQRRAMLQCLCVDGENLAGVAVQQ